MSEPSRIDKPFEGDDLREVDPRAESGSAKTATRGEAESTPSYFPYERYESQKDILAERYQGNQPYHHLYFDDFLNEDVARAMANEFPRHSEQTWIEYKHVNEKKAGLHERDKLPDLIGKVVDELNSDRFVALVSKLTGIDGLLADDSIEGGGIHQAERGGFLNVHTDFTMHRTRPNWRRRCNLIIYLNEGWQEEWGGNIEFWEEDMSAAAASYPAFLNSAVLFDTPGALHGFPDPLTCPDTVARQSVQFYYYTIDESASSSIGHATSYHARPTDKRFKSFLIASDNVALAIYAWMKHRLGISDAFISRVLDFFGRGRK